MKAAKTGRRQERIFAGLVLGMAAVLVAAGALLRGRGGALVAEVRAGDGQGIGTHRVALLELSPGAEPVRLSMRELGVDVPVYFELADGRIRFVGVDCPDKLCEGFGWLDSAGESAVCMPNRVSVTVIERSGLSAEEEDGIVKHGQTAGERVDEQ